MHEQSPAPQPKAHVDPVIYVLTATFSLAVIFGFLFNWVPMWVVGVIGLVCSLVIYCSCPPMIHYSQ